MQLLKQHYKRICKSVPSLGHWPDLWPLTSTNPALAHPCSGIPAHQTQTRNQALAQQSDSRRGHFRLGAICFSEFLRRRFQSSTGLHRHTAGQRPGHRGTMVTTATPCATLEPPYSSKHCIHFIYIYAFSRRFYPKRLTVHSGYTFFVSMCSLGIEPTTFALLTQCSTTEPQELPSTDWY